ncbi:MAG TPA: FtsX-like permease family protein [Bryobacterales bacterium]|nr:FtsX-like permease family protein [Bryobacterales bacterium]
MLELFIARRYLRAKRKQAVISVITAISTIGVAAGVMALVIALAINNGFRQEMQSHLLGATSHVNLLEVERGYGIENWHAFLDRFRHVPHVVAIAPALYGQVMISGPIQPKGAVLKGIDPADELKVGDLLRSIKQGSLDALESDGPIPGLIVGKKLADEVGLRMGTRVTVMSPQGELTPFGSVPSYKPFRVVAIFDSGFYDFDSLWTFTTLKAAQQTLSLGDVINTVEFKLDDMDRAEPVSKDIEKIAGPHFSTTTWMEQNRALLHALKMERLGTVITIGLIEMVAALNILISLVMMVMEKYRDIAILMSMGMRREQVAKIFMYQGTLIGVAGSAIGLALGYALCYLGARYHWIHLDPDIYGLSYLPFQPHAWDGAWIAAAAILVSFLATLYPARSATRIAPVEVLRYE